MEADETIGEETKTTIKIPTESARCLQTFGYRHENNSNCPYRRIYERVS